MPPKDFTTGISGSYERQLSIDYYLPGSLFEVKFVTSEPDFEGLKRNERRR